MGSTTAGKIIDDLSVDMFDTQTDRRYDEPKLLSILSDGQETIASLKPDESTSPEKFQLVEGIYQTLPDGIEALIRPIRNMGQDGLTKGPAIKTVDYDHFIQRNPDWFDDDEAVDVKLIMFDPQNRYGFFCYPPQPSQPTYISAVCGVMPSRITARTATIGLRDSNVIHLYHYCMYRLYKTMQSPVAKAESIKFWNLFVVGLDRKDLVDKEYNPNRDRKKEQRSLTSAD
jgi:hypothetical protein